MGDRSCERDAGTVEANESPRALRAQFARGERVRPTAGLAPGFVQANLVVLPRDAAFDFLLFAQRNPKPCPLLEVIEAGAHRAALDGTRRRHPDGRAPLPRVPSTARWWTSRSRSPAGGGTTSCRSSSGCSFTFESALADAGIPVRHIDQGCNVPMFITSLPTVPAGAFHGPMVVSMRPIPAGQVIRAVQVTSRFPSMHGAPVHIGDPGAIGIADIARPDLGDPVEIKDGEVPVFWACGVTPQAVAMASKPPLVMTHAPGHMFVTDWRDADYSVL